MSEPASETAIESPAPPAAATPPKRAPRPAPPETRRLPPYKVLLHNDDVNEMAYVVRAIRELTPLNAAQSTVVMLTAHTRGLALLLVTHKERAELYVEQFRSKRLRVTIEPA